MERTKFMVSLAWFKGFKQHVTLHNRDFIFLGQVVATVHPTVYIFLHFINFQSQSKIHFLLTPNPGISLQNNDVMFLEAVSWLDGFDGSENPLESDPRSQPVCRACVKTQRWWLHLRGGVLYIARPCPQSEVTQGGEEVLHLLLQELVSVLSVLARPLRVA